MTADRPHLVIVGGPNGSGKTTIARELERVHGLRYLGADAIAEVRRRFPRSLSNFWHLCRPLADHWHLLLNSGDVPLDVAIDKAGADAEVLDEALFSHYLALIGETDDSGTTAP